MSSVKSVNIGGLKIGGGAPVRVESMLKTPLEDVAGCVLELDGLARAGCELVRVAFPREGLRGELRQLVTKSPIPIMADIHFNHRFAIAALDCGCRSVRINPGNMGTRGLAELISAARANGAVIRIGSNGGSLSAAQLESADGDRAAALVAAVEEQLLPLASAGFEDVVISAKSSSVPQTTRANFILSQRYPFPLHVGITEAGQGVGGAVKSAVGLGILLSQGIGDTMRVSLTGASKDEAETAYSILRALGVRNKGINFVSCPGCGRRRIDVERMAGRVKALLPDGLPDGLTVAVMGCEVNGPKEAAEADIGLAGTQNGFVLFKKGKTVATGGEDTLEETLKTFLAAPV
ncbi:MAG: (E)-4-hydroxy-3-methylbut-2-enyl-diphosphate synthase [Synergistaceae bacterium]|jgi:(E)-4-hydroxy-3-methylbut-2-enyl-diphosphate synthase|nr:(E)-4-hydroxy-3-methylbut-2-enyl-diphosphate synthase [Synergistaceae bacterium]